jgi:hypothetical protein
VSQTHILVFVPQTVNDRPLDLQYLGELMLKYFPGHDSSYRSLYLGAYVDGPAPASHWVLLTRGVIEGSRSQSYEDQQVLLASLCEKAHVSYEVPKILDVAVCLFMEYIRTGTRLYPDDPWTLTRCQEKYNANWQLGVGGFAPGGLSVNYRYGGDSEHCGVGGSRKLEAIGH